MIFHIEEYIASLEIVNYENYMLLEEIVKKRINIFSKKELELENHRLYLEGGRSIRI